MVLVFFLISRTVLTFAFYCPGCPAKVFLFISFDLSSSFRSAGCSNHQDVAPCVVLLALVQT